VRRQKWELEHEGGFMNHEKLACYERLIDIASKLGLIIKRWPRGYSYLADQLQRAVSSAVLNLAEGNGKQAGHKERRRFFRIAMGSLSEASAALDLCLAFSLISPLETHELKTQLKFAYCGIRKLP
jgi:four helix bundle protein